VNGNRAFLKDFEYHIFDIFDIDNQKYFGVEERKHIIKRLYDSGYSGGTVHQIAFDTLKNLGLDSIEKCLKFAEEQKVPGNDNIVEGVVFKSADGQFSFKAVSNEYLLKWKL
jgi:ATP-dependent RNA circularization protein (DNA/RNA ligase family)